MKTKYFIIAILTILCFATGTASAQNKSTGDKKILIAYYSRTNNTRQIAENIKSLVGGDLVRIETQKEYPSDYHTTTEVAKKEKEANERPALKAKIDDMAQYDIIFIGFPIWWSDTPMAIATFLESYDLKGKTVIPFCSHGGGGVGEAFNRVKSLTPGAENKEGLVLSGSGSKSSVESWLKKIEIIK
jgi:flavodoxin